ncbi:hypothetical protein L1887_35144 [Cichorium endivia]|nr:hypothetical protein L1887_35144 [Cichorium endivia]
MQRCQQLHMEACQFVATNHKAQYVVTRGFWVGLGFCILGLNVVGLPRFVYVSSSSLFLLTITRSPRFLFTITFIAFFSGQVETEATAFFR